MIKVGSKKWQARQRLDLAAAMEKMSFDLQKIQAEFEQPNQQELETKPRMSMVPEEEKTEPKGVSAEFVRIETQGGDQHGDLEPNTYFIDVRKMGPVRKPRKVKWKCNKLQWSISEDEHVDTSTNKIKFKQQFLYIRR